MNDESGTYASAGTPAIIKDYRARYAAALRARGVPLETLVEASEGQLILEVRDRGVGVPNDFSFSARQNGGLAFRGLGSGRVSAFWRRVRLD